MALDKQHYLLNKKYILENKRFLQAIRDGAKDDELQEIKNSINSLQEQILKIKTEMNADKKRKTDPPNNQAL
ncbi:MAG: hypothetical protein JWN76_1896 [Chitinophagaceae bacterium]|nr:hypothetical protein [Chitinophagaceae bacterium]